MAITEGMTLTPVAITDDVFAEAQACFTTEQLVELVATVSMENYRARFNRAFLVESLGVNDRRRAQRTSRSRE